MKLLLLALTFSMAGTALANGQLTDEAGERCIDKASRVSKQYLVVSDVFEKLGLSVSEEDKVVATSFKNTTPGSYDQIYVSNVSINNDQKIRVTFSGEFNCDSLKVKSIVRLK